MVKDLSLSHCSIRRATLSDAAALARLAERTFRETFAADNRPEDMDAYCAEAFTVDVQHRLLGDAQVATLVAVDSSSALIGYAQLRPGAPPEVAGPAPMELWRLYVDRSRHGSGVAPQLMEAVLETAAAAGAQTLWLGVWERNPRAQAFYRKMGFADVGSHTFLLGADPQTDRLMARPVGGPHVGTAPATSPRA